MGLDKLLYEVGYVHSDNNADDIIFNENAWTKMMIFHPVAAYTLLSQTSDVNKEDVKFFIQLIDNILQENIDVRGVKISEDEKDHLQEVREDLVDMLKR